MMLLHSPDRLSHLRTLSDTERALADDMAWQTVTLCALIAEARAIADVTDTLLAAHLSLAESRALELRAELIEILPKATARPAI